MDLLAGRRVAFAGQLAGMPRREAQQLVRNAGGTCLEGIDASADLIVVGEAELPLDAHGQPNAALDADVRQAAEQGMTEILSETQLWQRLGLVENEQNVHRLYTPAMLAELLGVSVSIVRRWHRRGLIRPAREVRKLPYFDFQEVATARRLAELVAAGVSPQSIEKQLAALARLLPDVQRPLAQLSVIVEGKALLLRQGDGMIDPKGQWRLDFEAAERTSGSESSEPATLSMPSRGADHDAPATPAEMFAWAAELEDDDQLDSAVDMVRAALAAGGPTAEGCFQLAELLYRLDQPQAAIERYFVAIELDEDYVEARANLGCVLAESGRLELAVAAFEGALAYHRDYADVHYHLARTLEELDRHDEAASHWQAFIELCPDSPWSDEAQQRLESGTP